MSGVLGGDASGSRSGEGPYPGRARPVTIQEPPPEGGAAGDGRRHLLLFCFAVDADHPTLNFALGWYRGLLGKYSGIDIIAFDVGRHDLPPSIRVHPLKRPGDWRIARMLRFWRLAAGICRRERPVVVFSHMNTALVVAFLPLAWWYGLRQVLWYAHAQVSLLLRAAIVSADRVVTSTPQGCRIATGKLRCIGQGVDEEVFAVCCGTAGRHDAVTAGRIAASKNLDLIIEGFLQAGHPSARLHIIGSPACAEDVALEQDLHRRYASDRRIVFHGFLAPAQMAEVYADCAVFINLSRTGSLDKANLEAALAGLAVITSNAAFCAWIRERNLPGDLLLDGPGTGFSGVLRQVLDRPEPFLVRHAVIGSKVRAEFTRSALIERLCVELAACERSRDIACAV